MKNYKIEEDLFIQMISTHLSLRNHWINEMNAAVDPDVKYYYQKEIDQINESFDRINRKFKTKF